MDILCTFEDGTTELRPANSPAHWANADRLRHVRRIGPEDMSAVARGSFSTIADNRGLPKECFSVWRLTGHTEEPYTLTGEWQSCRVETVEEQIARLTRERDAVIRDVRGFVYDIATNYDHDEDGHRHGTACRQCDAQALARKLGISIPEWAR